MSKKTYKDCFNESPILKTSVVLKTYSGETLRVIGKINVSIKHEHQETAADIFIIEGTGTTLIGRDILERIKMNWSTVNKVNSEEIPEESGGAGSFGLDTITKIGYFWKMGKISLEDPPTQPVQIFLPRYF